MKKWFELKESGKLNTLFINRREQELLERSISVVLSKKFDTWDIQWLFTCLYNRALSISPCRNLVSNIGYGDDSAHNLPGLKALAKLTASAENIWEIKHPTHISRNYEADEEHLETVYGQF